MVSLSRIDDTDSEACLGQSGCEHHPIGAGCFHHDKNALGRMPCSEQALLERMEALWGLINRQRARDLLGRLLPGNRCCCCCDVNANEEIIQWCWRGGHSNSFHAIESRNPMMSRT